MPSTGYLSERHLNLHWNRPLLVQLIINIMSRFIYFQTSAPFPEQTTPVIQLPIRTKIRTTPFLIPIPSKQCPSTHLTDSRSQWEFTTVQWEIEISLIAVIRKCFNKNVARLATVVTFHLVTLILVQAELRADRKQSMTLKRPELSQDARPPRVRCNNKINVLLYYKGNIRKETNIKKQKTYYYYNEREITAIR